VWGFGGGATDVAAVAIGTTRFKNHLGLTVGALEMGLALGITFGPFLGGFMYETGGFVLPLLVIGIITWSLAAISYFLLPSNELKCERPRSRNKSESTSSVEMARETLVSVVSFFKNFWIVMTCLTVFLINSVRGLLGAALSAFLDQQYELSPESIGFFFMVAAGTNALFAAPSGKLADKIGPRWCIYSGVILVGGGCFAMVLGSSTAMIFVAMVIIGSGCGLALGTALVHLTSESLAPGAARSENSMGILTGVLAFCSAFGLVAGSVAGGLLSTEFGFQTAGLVWGCCCSGWGIVYSTLHVLVWFSSCIR
jgi:MFS family permease